MNIDRLNIIFLHVSRKFKNTKYLSIKLFKKFLHNYIRFDVL